jgi:hypothetical protein
MRITQILAELEAKEAERMAGVEGISPLAKMQAQSDDPEAKYRAIVAKLKRPKPTKIMRQILSENEEARPLLRNLSLGYAEEY